jgi:hypothetical protein
MNREYFDFDPRDGSRVELSDSYPDFPNANEFSYTHLGVDFQYVVAYLDRGNLGGVVLQYTGHRQMLRPHTKQDYERVRHPDRRGRKVNPGELWMRFGIVLRLEEWLLADYPLPKVLYRALGVDLYMRSGVESSWPNFSYVVDKSIAERLLSGPHYP